MLSQNLAPYCLSRTACTFLFKGLLSVENLIGLNNFSTDQRRGCILHLRRWRDDTNTCLDTQLDLDKLKNENKSTF